MTRNEILMIRPDLRLFIFGSVTSVPVLYVKHYCTQFYVQTNHTFIDVQVYTTYETNNGKNVILYCVCLRGPFRKNHICCYYYYVFFGPKLFFFF
jgi:hypothetical protein